NRDNSVPMIRDRETLDVVYAPRGKFFEDASREIIKRAVDVTSDPIRRRRSDNRIKVIIGDKPALALAVTLRRDHHAHDFAVTLDTLHLSSFQVSTVGEKLFL